MRENGPVAKRDTVEVLLVEDDPADVLMIQEALAQSAVAVHLHVAVDGEQALHFLRKTHEFAGAPRPSRGCLISICRAAGAWKFLPR